jgi:hypothetical protein
MKAIRKSVLWVNLTLISLSPITGFSQKSSVPVFIHQDAGKEGKVAAELLVNELNKSGNTEAFVEPVANFKKGIGIYLMLREQADQNMYDTGLTNRNSEGLSVLGSKNQQQVYLVANSPLGLRHAVFFYLEELGYRYFFPHRVWHIIPDRIVPYQQINILTSPDFDHRRIWYAYGTDSERANRDYDFWVKASRTEGAFQVNAGHSYQNIIKRNKKAFENHPEYYAQLPGGSRKPTNTAKFCYSNEGLIELVTKDAIRQFAQAKAAGKQLDMVSLEPSDGAGHCSCDECKKLGNISNRVFFLANEVAKAVSEEYPNKWVGLYAYNQHAAPPSFDLEPNVFVMVTTAFNKSAYSTDQLVDIWSKKVSKIGIYDYYGVMAWDWDMPGQPRGSQINYVKNGLTYYHAHKGTAFSAETNIGWVSRGLGHYLASKMLWDVNADTDKLSEEFFRLAFGKAESLMRELYGLWTKNTNIPPTSYDIARWLSLVEQADDLVQEENLQRRILHIKYYLHYVALFHKWRNDPKDLTKYSELLNYAWRIKGTGTVASYPLIRRIANSQAPSPKYKFDNKQAVWKQPNTPIRQDDINALIEQDVKKFKPIEGLSEIVYSTRLSTLPDVKKKHRVYEQNYTINAHEMIFKIPDGGDSHYHFFIKSGFIKSNPPGGYVHISLYNESNGEVGEMIKQLSIPKDRSLLTIKLDSLLEPGTYHMKINDRKSGFRFRTSGNFPYALLASSQSKVSTWDRSNFHFYVPEGTKKFLVIRDVVFSLKSPTGRAISFDQEGKKTIEIEVQANEAGFWQMARQKGSFYFEGIPPYVSGSPEQLLLPDGLLNTKKYN